MRDERRQGRITEAEVEARLADAGRVLLALPWAGCFPCGFRTLWPETESERPRHPVPTSHQISAMDQVYRWTTLIAEPEAWRQLKLLAIAEGKTSHDLLIEAVNLLFDHYNRPTIAG